MKHSYWQVQELDGTSVSDCRDKDEADYVAARLTEDFQRGFRVREMAGYLDESGPSSVWEANNA